MNQLAIHLQALYGDDVGTATFRRLSARLENYRALVRAPRTVGVSERDAILITYGDQVQSPDAPPLDTLADFCARYLAGLVSGIHLLPFYPYSSDDGFSVIDYRSVNPALGDWDDIMRLGSSFRLMFDAVINHISVESEWFTRFLHDDVCYRSYFIVVPDGVDLSRVVRPRALPLLTSFETPSGKKNVWTTFSADQVDLNYANPDVLVDILDSLIFYVAHGAEWIRLDAIAYLWKQVGTSCVSLPQTHLIVQIIRAILDEVAPHVQLVTETNVPHAENISYLSDGRNEAQMVYNFALPPLVLHSFYTGSTRALSSWASALALPSDRTTFFNFLASHDGIGLNPVRGILDDADIDALVARALAHGGLVSFKSNPDGTRAPYELNINYFDALCDPSTDEPVRLQVARFMAAQAIMLSLVGVPGIYFHSLFGSRGWKEGVAQIGQNRTINRQKYDRSALEEELADSSSRRHLVFEQYARLLRARAAHPAFNPHGSMNILDAGQAVFAVLRQSAAGGSVLCFHNVSDSDQTVDTSLFQALGTRSDNMMDLISGKTYSIRRKLTLEPFQVLWLKGNDSEST